MALVNDREIDAHLLVRQLDWRGLLHQCAAQRNGVDISYWSRRLQPTEDDVDQIPLVVGTA
jgi:hypothetical protein